MSAAADQQMRDEQDKAMKELHLWHSANVIREAFKRGDAEAINLIEELKNEAD